jgi:acetylornithine deacetylase
MDTWQRDPFGAEIEGDHLFGLGAGDMKGGVAIALTVAQAIKELDIDLKGDLLVETVVDEEFGGVNGTLAGRVRGHNADAAVLLEPTNLEVYPAARGARIINLELTSRSQVVGGEVDTLAFERLPYLLQQIKVFADQRQQGASAPDLFKAYENPVPVWVTKLTTGPWSYEEPIATPGRLLIQIYWQMMPGEKQADVDDEFHAWLDGVIASKPEWYKDSLTVETEYVVRFMPGTMIESDHPFVQAFSRSVSESLQTPAKVIGAPFPCDLFAIQQDAGIPGLVFGAAGGNYHGADEFLDLESQWQAARALFAFVLEWCGVAEH